MQSLDSSVNQDKKKEDMEKQKKRDAENEFQMFCFVMKNKHTNPGTKSSADSSGKEQGGFRNAPHSFSGFVFIQTKLDK